MKNPTQHNAQQILNFLDKIVDLAALNPEDQTAVLRDLVFLLITREKISTTILDPDTYEPIVSTFEQDQNVAQQQQTLNWLGSVFKVKPPNLSDAGGDVIF